MPALNELTASSIVRAIASGSASCEDVARACLDRISEREAQVQAWAHLDADFVIAQARKLDRSGSRGPLAGVPFAAKDIIDTADLPTEYGSPIYKGHRPGRDAACVALGRRAGGILMGKAVTTEFANFHPGNTRNPLDLTRTPGGSSSGSAAAVADFMVPLALGTQTTASTIRPASFCGIFGYRPTYGDLRCSGVMEASGSLDTLGLFARSLEDIVLYRDVLLGISPPESAPEGRPPRIGFCRTHLWQEVEPACAALLEGAATRLAAAGASVTDVELPGSFDAIEDVHLAISSFEFSRNFAWEIDHHWDRISETLRNGRLKAGLACSFERYRSALDAASALRRQMDEVFAGFDVLLTAPTAGEAPVGLQATGNAKLCMIWTAMHVPAVSLPVFAGPNGLPFGAQLVGRRGGDADLFRAADWVFRKLA
jgi:Asp-tRNA(Asn)/Glu-tRNA(Gln) amidotransferase A subunit family amidase